MASSAFFRRLFVQLRTNNQCHVFLNAIRRSLKLRPNKLLAERFCSKLFSVKSYAQMRECFEGIKAFSLHVYKPFSFKFCIQCGLESANFGCWVVCAINCHTKLLGFPLKFKIKTVSIFLHFLSSQTVTSQVLFPNIFKKAGKQWF